MHAVLASCTPSHLRQVGVAALQLPLSCAPLTPALQPLDHRMIAQQPSISLIMLTLASQPLEQKIGQQPPIFLSTVLPLALRLLDQKKDRPGWGRQCR